MLWGIKAMPANQSGMKASAAHRAGRHRGDSSFPSGKTSGRTRPVRLAVEVNGFGPDPYGGTRAGFSATTEINRNEWNVSYNGPIPGAGTGMVLSDKVTINLEIEGILSQGE